MGYIARPTCSKSHPYCNNKKSKKIGTPVKKGNALVCRMQNPRSNKKNWKIKKGKQIILFVLSKDIHSFRLFIWIGP